MKRYYYLSDDLDQLERVEQELKQAGLAQPQIQVLSSKDAEVAAHHKLHRVDSVMKKDVVHSGEWGAVIGVVGAVLVLVLTYFTGWYQSVTWIPFLFLAVIVLGFCTWEGGLFGLRKNNVHFRRFEQALRAGKHVFFVDIEDDQRRVVDSVLAKHPELELIGVGRAKPRVFVWGQKKWRAFLESAP